ncbi:hypothetical protein LWC35_19200 [Pseudonocardia kujensis]|uniref:hypothetical protein n=1 Tax=Pseudonocardia kujensis TaxID=1128675 RepID=UPI001E4B2F42|nr:hypothetical protein [Pseudonocardia kujensis]MCE0765011.1 hypothetical protein [Pseudonocardia kujensis]
MGSGPSGCYIAQFLAKAWPDSEITVFESLPAPYGLVRYGVAADHQGAKAVTRQFDRLFARRGVRFAGNITIGRHLDFAQVAASFDIVVLATGLPDDRELGVPCDPGAYVVGAGALLRTLNGFPSPVLPHIAAGRSRPIGSRVVIVGMGNVAVDVMRLLSKDATAFAGSDIDDDRLRQLRPTPPRSIDTVARSTASEAKCDLAMLRELVALPTVDIAVTGLDDCDDGPVADLLRKSAAAAPSHRPCPPGVRRTQITFHFGLVPEALLAREGRTVLTARRARLDQAKPLELAADTIITAIGFTHGSTLDEASPREHWDGDHVYRVGWLSRGARGTIPENRKDAQRLARTIIADVEAERITTGRPGFRAVEASILHRTVTFDDWQRIDAFERRSARADRCRQKITDLGQMLAVAGARHGNEH